MNQLATNLKPQSYSLNPDRPPRSWLMVILLICAFLAVALTWASLAELDELSRAQGKVIPSGKTQIIQSAEPGVVNDILVREGEQVKAGQLLVKLDDTNTSSSQGEIEAKVMALRAQVARLKDEAQGNGTSTFTCPQEVEQEAPSVCDSEVSLQQARRKTLDQGKQVLEARVEQRQRELNQALADKDRLTQTADLAQQKLDLIKPMVDKKLVSQTEYLTTQQSLADAKGQLDATIQAIAKGDAALSEAQLQVQQADSQFRQDAQTDLTGKLAELASGEETLRGASDRVSRTDIRSPVDGVINSLAVNTLGGFVNAGEKILDIVPVGEKLLIEARLQPSDIAFILPGQEANIKFTAYDFSIFGGMHGKVQNVSADSIVDPQTHESYYTVLIATDSSSLTYRDRQLPVLPGMVASVEILTGHKTVLQYLLKPINKTRDEAFHER